MRSRSVWRLGLALALAVPPGASAETPQALLEQIDASRLDTSAALSVGNLKIGMRVAELTIHSGTLYPASPIDGRTVEMVFLGDATLHVDPGDDIERGQLELFTGSETLEEPITEAVMVVCFDAAADVLLGRDPATDADPERDRRADELYRKWKHGTERKLLDVRASLLVDALGDPQYQSYFAGQFRSEDLGVFLMAIEPDSAEQLSVGKFERPDADAQDKKKVRRYIARQQRRGRLLGLDVEDLGIFDQWILTPMRDAAGNASPGRAAFEARHYDLDVEIDKDAENLRGTARIRVQPKIATRRVVTLQMASDLRIEQVRGPGGDELFFLQDSGNAYVFLDAPPPADSMLELEADFAGAMLLRVDSKVFALRETTDWYPRVGDLDRATYSVKLTWPKALDLVAAGKRVESGKHEDGRPWERRTVDVPATGFSFEIGKFDVREFEAGDIQVTLALDRLSNLATEKWIKDQIAAVVTDSLAFYQHLYGPYPLDYLTVVTVPRDYAQGLLGFVTLPSLLTLDLGYLQDFYGWEDRRTVIAHEIAHQWWGNVVGWKSYRDQWLSEAMANHAALVWSQNRLSEVEHRGPIDGWQDLLTDTTTDGRPIESIGPLTLGTRLSSSRADAYDAIVYQKGAVVLNMLAMVFGESRFIEAQKQLVKVAHFKEISTEDYIRAMETMGGSKLDWFAKQYVYGTGLPEIYYKYDLGEPEGGKWNVKVVAYQQTPYHYRYFVEDLGDGVFDVRRETLGQIDVGDSSLVVPFELTTRDPALNGKKKKKDAPESPSVTGRLVIRGQTTEAEIPSELEPEEVWLDPDNVVFGRFFSEDRSPKRLLLYRGMDADAADDEELAEELLRKTLSTAVGDGRTEREVKSETEVLDARARVLLTGMYLDQGKLDQARETLELAKKSVSGARKQWFADLFRTLDARVAVLEGDFDGALKRLKRGMKLRALPTQAYVLAAIAAKKAGDDDAFEKAAEAAEARGADLTALDGI